MHWLKRAVAPVVLGLSAALLMSAPSMARDVNALLMKSLGQSDDINPVVAETFRLVGEDLTLVAACFERVRLYIGNDSGLMHLAAAAGAPTLGLFGPTPDGRYDPWGAKTAQVRGPRSREEILAAEGAGFHGPNAMQDLTVDMVYEAAVALLARTQPENEKALA